MISPLDPHPVFSGKVLDQLIVQLGRRTVDLHPPARFPLPVEDRKKVFAPILHQAAELQLFGYRVFRRLSLHRTLGGLGLGWKKRGILEEGLHHDRLPIGGRHPSGEQKKEAACQEARVWLPVAEHYFFKSICP